MSILDNIKKSSDIKELDDEQLNSLADEIRQEVISAVSQNGGHLASNLGVVELTMALHSVFDIPTDQIVWDVGHQCYVHKILSGRRDRLHTIRKYKGIAGFPKRDESPADPFGAGHASTSISAALGLATARDQQGLNHEVIAVIGDGALSGGLSFEGLNNAGASRKNLLVILNDNEMSISKNVGALSKYLTNIMTDKRFNKLRDEIWELTGRFKRRDKIRAMVSDIEKSIKGLFVPGYLFDKLGFRYFGPIDGHDLPLLKKTLTQIKSISGPRLLHVVTVKGKGFAPAEANATKFHGIGAFDKITGETNSKSSLPGYTRIFGDTMIELAEKDKRIVAITAAMSAGTGLTGFAEKFPDRFFDVGIAEGHATCFASGLAAGGIRPYVAIYSTFLQRAYDQIIHDAALQKLPVVFCIDRAGLVGDDGPTHHGCFDLSYLSVVPNMTIMSPKDGDEFRSMLHTIAGRELDGPCAVRYPRGSVPYPMTGELENIEWGRWQQISQTGEIAVIGVGTMFEVAKSAQEMLKDRREVALINARFIKPLDTEMLNNCIKNYRQIITIEENGYIGGLGQMIGNYLLQNGFKGGFHSFAIPDRFISQGTRKILLDEIGLNADTLVRYIDDIYNDRRTILEKLHLKKGAMKINAVAVNGNYGESSAK
ncbi:MAG: 1-deoxy-D-xylulose-5-phosphate synthase [candidate division Zixibacteria bacterium HGW-Zixibacteria-1]|nr:MAG: 1-deoxy-D-xylulose-5-phosphate synthase [candidate division Zixibacteria bacterium HGW-Zixibacteria-1]